MIDWTKVKQDTSILIENCPFCEPITRKFSHFENGKVWYFEYGYVGPEFQWDVKGMDWAHEEDCSLETDFISL
jgi:hypothetical protein